MGDIEIEIDIDGADKVRRALDRGLGEGLDETGKTLLRQGKEKAVDEVALVREWNSDVKNGFQTDVFQFNRSYYWKGKIVNPVPHADIVDRGLAPAGEITGADPSVQDIMPWVVDNLSPKGNPDPSSWNSDLRDLAEEYSPGYVLTAFAVRESIEQEGYPGIHFTDTTKQYMGRVGRLMIKKKVEKHMNRELRKAGLK